MPDKQLHVLLIDDEPHLLLGLSAVMKRAGFLVTTASNGSKGLEEIQKGGIDIIVCDVMMPPPNGMQLKALLAEMPETASTPFIFLTARTNMGDKIAGLNLGADDYITKPFKVEELVARVKSVWRRHQIGRQQGLAEAGETIDQLQRFLRMTAQLVAEDGELVELSEISNSLPSEVVSPLLDREAVRKRLDELGGQDLYPMGMVIFKIRNHDPVDQRRSQLRTVARALHRVFSSKQWIYQLAVDEFIVLLPRFEKSEAVQQLNEVRRDLSEFNRQHGENALQLRLGMAVGHQGGRLSELMQDAEKSMTDFTLTR